VTVLSSHDRDANQIDDYRGLFRRRPMLALVLTAMMLSLAGIPLTAGFFGKFYIVAAGATTGAWALLLILIITSTIGLFYYLRVVFALFQHETEGEQRARPARRSLPAAALVLSVLTLVVIWLGVYPSPLLKVIQTAISALL
jgi:NADH-quinone oxidoreductase subunit N